MLRIKVFICSVFFLAFSVKGIGQTLNWNNLKPEQRHILSLQTGWDYGIVFGAGYGYQLKSKWPIVLGVEYSFPSGKNLVDDFKSKIGGQVRIVRMGDFQLAARIQGIFRRNQNDLVSMLNFGSDMAATIGFYKSKWFLAGEVGFDKAIVTHFKHSDRYREIFPAVTDGWYEPATGGNFYYGLQTGITFERVDITLKAGKVTTQDFVTTPLIPFYAQLGFNYRFTAR